ncbi:MAG: suppressor of fused domain protein [Bifidobacteriaceae bacterium]|jgi:hypothetical protein|nr:suppressor of fused domain protein [Bifidobacteriaceae bacterium]
MEPDNTLVERRPAVPAVREPNGPLNDRELRVEFLVAVGSEFEVFGKVMSSCAFNISKLGYSVHPGTVCPDVISQYDPTLAMRHVMFESVFQWDAVPNLELPEMTVTWLSPVPISDAEFEFRSVNGAEALRDLLEERSVDVLDLNRPSTV